MNSNKDTVRGDSLATVSPGMLPPPFTVRWSTKSDCWVVWMPETNNLLMIDGTFILITGISAAPELPSGWYTVDDLVPGSDSIYLVITITDSTGSATADLSGTQGTSSSGETVYNVKIASMATDPNTDEKSIEQYTNSSVIIGSGGSGGRVTPDDVSTGFIPDPPAGQQPDGDEGKLQIKGFKSGTPVTVGNLADYLQGGAALPQDGIFLVARVPQTGGGVALAYMPVSQIFHNQSGDLSVEFVQDNDWYATSHVLRKRLRILNLKTGNVTDKANTTYANGWEVMAETVGISTILARQSGNGNA